MIHICYVMTRKSPVLMLSSMKVRQFPGVRQILDEQSARNPFTNEDLAKGAKISLAAASNYRRGRRAPPADIAEKIAQYFYPEDSDAARAMVARFREAARDPEVRDSAPAARETIGRRKLEVTSVDYPPFSGARHDFFESLFRRFFALSDLQVPPVFRAREAFGTEDFSSTDVALSVFESPDRMAHNGLKFWRAPIKISLGAVIHRDYEGRIDEIAAALIDPSANRGSIRPIVVRGEVGAIHCKQRLGFRDSEITELTVRGADALKAQLEKEPTAGVVPVIVVDDLTALLVLKTMGKEGRPVFPMNTREAIQRPESSARRELPAYYLALATRRNEYEFTWFMQESLPWFLSMEVETTAIEWVRLARRLADVVLTCSAAWDSAAQPDVGAMWADAWRWVWYALTLDKNSIDTYFDQGLPWGPILNRARKLLQSHFAHKDQEHILLRQIRRLFRSEHGGTRLSVTPASLKQLCELFDVSLDGAYVNADRYTDKPNHLVRVLQAALLDEPPKIEIEVESYDPADPSSEHAAKAVKRLILELERMYDEMAGEARGAVERIEEDLRHLADRYGGKNGCIVLASLAEQKGSFIGGLCLRRMGVEAGGADLRFRICYLWVARDYRQSRAGSRLVEKAIELARAAGADSVYVELLPELKETIHFFEKKQFRWADRAASAARRNVFEYPLAHPRRQD